MPSDSICILDNGAYTAKVGLASQDEPALVPNCIMKAKSERRRAFIGSQIEDCRDASGLFYMLCFQKGYLVNWDVQKTVWDHIFSPEGMSINLAEKILIVTEPQFNFTSIQEAMTEIFFEEFECEALCRTTAADLCAFNYFKLNPQPQPCCIVIDMGYSFTHIIPFVKGKKVKSGIRRIDVGGKLLTNHLKELISYRHINMMDESYVVNQIKEDVCFVSQDFKSDMKVQLNRYPQNTIVQDYVLPDFTSVKRGFLLNPGHHNSDQQTVRLNNERFTIPEILFHPSDVGIQQMGVPEAVLNCVEACPPKSHHILLANIIVMGGCSLFPGMRDRLETEIRCLAPDDMEVRISIAENPLTYAWHGGKSLSQSSNFVEEIISREDYEENGTRISLEKFDI